MAAGDLAALARPQAGPYEAVQLAGRLLHGFLFVTILSSFLVFIEPSPYEGFVGLLGLAYLFLGLTVDRKLIPLIVLLFVWNMSGLVSLLPVLYDDDAIKFMAVSFYLTLSAILFACLFAEDSVRRLMVMRSAYLLAAMIVSLIGIAAYFRLIPGADLFTMGDTTMSGSRIRSTFKDPNVFGPFLVLPLLFLVERILSHGISLGRLAAAVIIFTGLFLSFSRGAWMQFVVSAVLMVGLLFVSAPTLRFRMRIVAFALIALLGFVGLLNVLLTFDAVGNLFQQRASVLQEYDTGGSGRFDRQADSLPALIEHPNGLGPYQFHKYFKQDPHNVYINAFASYGWVGGIAYVLMVLSTLYVGFRYAFMRTPWQCFLIPALATFTGTVIEGFVVDTDHWRHFYLLMGIIWGLAIATVNMTHRRVSKAAPAL
jgi:O-antigen ligase